MTLSSKFDESWVSKEYVADVVVSGMELKPTFRKTAESSSHHCTTDTPVCWACALAPSRHTCSIRFIYLFISIASTNSAQNSKAENHSFVWVLAREYKEILITRFCEPLCEPTASNQVLQFTMIRGTTWNTFIRCRSALSSTSSLLPV